MSDKDFKVKNKLVLNGLTQAGPLLADSNKQVDAVAFLTPIQGGTGTTTAPSSGQVLYSAGGTTYTPTTLTSLDVKGATYSADAPANPVVGQVWIESDSSSDSFDPNIIRRKTITATAGQTTFTTDLEFIQGYEQVYFNGMLLLRTSDYTTPSNTSVVLAAAAAAGDIVEILSITNLNSINAATTTTNTFTGDQIIQGKVYVGGNSSSNAKLDVYGDDSRIRWELLSSVPTEISTNLAANAYRDKAADALSHSFKISGTEKMRIASNGSILSDNQKAQVNGTYQIVGDFGQPTWINLGTWTAPQFGHTLQIKIVHHDGYNASLNQNQETYIYFKTSNNASLDANGFAADGYFYNVSNGAGRGISAVKVVANAAGINATTYTFYVYFGAYFSASIYSVECGQNTLWTHNGVINATEPGNPSSTVALLFNTSGSAGTVEKWNTGFTLQTTHAGKFIEINSSSSTTVSVPAFSYTATNFQNFAIGTKITFLQTGSGRINFSGSGATINGTGTGTRTQWSSATLVCRDTNLWVLYGDIS